MKKYKVNKKISRKRKVSALKRKIIFIFLPILLVFLAFIFMLNQQSFLIEKYNITGDDFLDKEKIVKTIDKNLKGRNFLFISKKNFLLYPEGKIEKDLENSFIEIDNVDISYKSFGEYRILNVDIKQKENTYLWCGDGEFTKCRFVSNSGSILGPFEQKKTKKKKEDFIIFLGKIEKEKASENSKKNKENKEEGPKKKSLDYFVKGTNLKNLERGIKDFSSLGLKIKSVKKIELGDYVLEDKDGVKIIVNKNFGNKTIENFKDIVKFEDISFDKKNGKFSDNLEYINLLFGKSVVYCKKSDVCVGNY